MAAVDESSPAYWLELYEFCFVTINTARRLPPGQVIEALLSWFTKLKECGDDDKAGAVAFLSEIISFQDPAVIKETNPRTERMQAAIAKIQALHSQIRTQEDLDQRKSELKIGVTATAQNSPAQNSPAQNSPESWNAPVHDVNTSEIDVTDPFLQLDKAKDDVPLAAKKLAEEDEKPDSQKLVALCPMGSEEAKQYLGTEWKNAQFVVLIHGKHEYFPRVWDYKDTGCTIRAKIVGGKIAKRLRFHVQYRNERVPAANHDAYLEFYENGQVQSYVGIDKTIKRPKKGEKRDSYFLVKFSTSGGIGYGLDYESDEFDDATKNTFRYLRSLCTNFSESTDAKPSVRYVNLRVNAHYFHADDEKDKRRRAAYEFARNSFLDFARDEQISQPWDMYRSPSGQPQTQWNQWISRQVIHERSGGMIKYPSFVSFPDLSTAAIALCYGSFVEWRREKEVYSELSRSQHQVAFVNVADKGILAVIKFAEPKLKQQEAFRLKDGDLLRMSFRAPGNATAKHSRCAAMAIPDLFNLPYGQDSLLLVLGKRLEFFKSFAVEVGQQLQYLPTTVVVNIPERGAQRQVDAINRLCGMTNTADHLQRWRKLFLNQHSGERPRIDPTKCLEKSDEEIDNVIQSMIDLPKMSWSEEQVQCLKSCRSFPEGMLLMQGFPGAGKTYTLVAMAKIFLDLGMHVIFSTPTHYAADAICQTMEKFNGDTGSRLDPLRTYRESSEVHALKSRGIEDPHVSGETHAEEFGPLDDLTSDFATTSVANDNSTVKNTGNPQQRTLPTCEEILSSIFPDLFSKKEHNVSVNTPEDDGTSESLEHKFEPREYSEGTQLQMIELAQSIRKGVEDRCYGLPRMSLEARAVRAALDAEVTGTALVGHYPSAEQIAVSKGVPPEDAYDAGFEEGEEADMFAELRKYLQLMQEQPMSAWDKEDRRKADLCFKKVCQHVMGQASLIVSTNNNLASSIPARHFGEGAKGIILIRDEDPKELEPNGWIPLAKMDHADKIQGVVLCGDLKQLQPTVLSAKEEPGYNEFALQLETSFAARLMKMGHPVLQLTEQRRFRPVFADWLNERVYAGQMRSHPCTTSIPVNPRWSSMMLGFLPIMTTASIDTGYLVLSPKNSNCQIDKATKSRLNVPHVDLVMEIVLRNHQEGAYRADEITIISPYKAQNVLYRQRLFSLVSDGRLPSNAVPTVATIDSQQGKESKVVILDWVVSRAETFGDIGFTADDHRGNVAHSRMREVLVNILPAGVASGKITTAPNERLNSFGEVVTSRIPYVCEFAKWAHEKRIVIHVDQESTSDSDSTTPPALDAGKGKGKEVSAVDESGPSSWTIPTTPPAFDAGKGKGKEASAMEEWGGGGPSNYGQGPTTPTPSDDEVSKSTW